MSISNNNLLFLFKEIIIKFNIFNGTNNVIELNIDANNKSKPIKNELKPDINRAIEAASMLLANNIDYRKNNYDTNLDKILKDNNFIWQTFVTFCSSDDPSKLISYDLICGRNNNQKKLFVKAEFITVRNRYIIAYGLGHFYLNHFKNNSELLFDDSVVYLNNFSTKEEQESRAFAMELLMPKEKVRDKYLRCHSAFVSDFADAFQVSNMLMRIRMNDLKLSYHDK